MSKELEALQRIRKNLTRYSDSDDKPYLYEQDKRDLDIIEAALKDYELMKQTKFIVNDKKINEDDVLEQLKKGIITVNNLKIESLFDEETQKKLKALEIIKEKRVNVHYLMLYQSYIEYNDLFCKKQLTETEWNLLKECL